MTVPPKKPTETQLELLNTYPGLVTLHPDQVASLGADHLSLIYGETLRYIMLLRYLASIRYEAAVAKYPPATAHRLVQRKLYEYYFGLLTDDSREALPMYEGDAADFEKTLERFRLSCDDVEGTLAYLKRFLPSQVEINGQTLHLHAQMRRPPEVQADDPVELIEYASAHDPHLRHHARVKLSMAQFRLEERRHGYAPELLRDQAHKINLLLRRKLFDEPEGEQITIVVDRDPERKFCCTGWKSYGEQDTVPPLEPHQIALTAERMHIKVGDKRVRVLFFIRPKEHTVLKAFIKDKRFLDLLDIGDSIAMMFVVDREDLPLIIPCVRRILVRCPGQVCEVVDPRNKWSSDLYEAEKFCLLLSDRVAEIQFVPKAAWVNALCMHDVVNHGLYKLRKYYDRVFPILWPEHLTGIPWELPAFRSACEDHVLRLVEDGVHL